MTFEEYSKIKHDPIYIFKTENGNKKITYFGAEHTHNPSKPIFQQIEKYFREANPQIVFVEGMHFSPGSKEKLIEEWKTVERDTIIKQHGESAFVFKLAGDAGIEAHSPEPSQKEEIQALLGRFSKEEIFAYYGYRQANSQHRLVDTLKFKEELSRYIQVIQRNSQWENFDYSYENLERIGKEIWGEDRGNLLIRDDARVNPVPGEVEKWTNINVVAQQSSYFRNAFMLQRIEEVMKEKDRLFIICGSSHAVMQEAAIKELIHNI